MLLSPRYKSSLMIRLVRLLINIPGVKIWCFGSFWVMGHVLFSPPRQLSAKTVEFRRRLRQGETVADIQAGLLILNSFSYLNVLNYTCQRMSDESQNMYYFAMSFILQRPLLWFVKLQRGNLGCAILTCRFSTTLSITLIHARFHVLNPCISICMLIIVLWKHCIY